MFQSRGAIHDELQLLDTYPFQCQQGPNLHSVIPSRIDAFPTNYFNDATGRNQSKQQLSVDNLVRTWLSARVWTWQVSITKRKFKFLMMINFLFRFQQSGKMISIALFRWEMVKIRHKVFMVSNIDLITDIEDI